MFACCLVAVLQYNCDNSVVTPRGPYTFFGFWFDKESLTWCHLCVFLMLKIVAFLTLTTTLTLKYAKYHCTL